MESAKTIKMDMSAHGLTIIRPYIAYYVELESDADNLAFLDIATIVVDHGNVIDNVYNYYDASTGDVNQFVARSILK